MSDLPNKLFIILLHIFSRLPLRISWFLAAIFGRILWLQGGRARHTTELNIRLCYPSLSRRQQQQIALRSLQETAKTALEMGPAWLWPTSKAITLIKKISGADVLADAATAGQGVILLAPHIGNWEVLGLYLGTHYQSVNLYQPPKSAALDKLIYTARLRTGSQLAPTDRKGIMLLLKSLRAGKMVGILPDQEPEPSGGTFAPFFGVPALTMTLVSNLVARTNAKVVCGMARRDEQLNGFELIFFTADPQIDSAELQESVTALNRSVEACVALAPEQYQWEYKRFKRRPNNEPRLYPKL